MAAPQISFHAQLTPSVLTVKPAHWSNLATQRLQCLQCRERRGCLVMHTTQKFCPFILPAEVSSSTT